MAYRAELCQQYSSNRNGIVSQLVVSMLGGTVDLDSTINFTPNHRAVWTLKVDDITSSSTFNAAAQVLSSKFHLRHWFTTQSLSEGYIPMRLPSFPTLVRTFYTFANTTRLQAPQKALSPFTRSTIVKSMPSIPFLGALFGSSASSSSSSKMTYPDKRSDQEWQAVLNKGQLIFPRPSTSANMRRRTIPRNPRKRHRSAVHGQIRQAHARSRRLHLRRLRRAPLQSRPQVQIRLWMARILRQYPRRRDETYRQHVRHGADGDRMHQLRRTPGACFQGGGV